MRAWLVGAGAGLGLRQAFVAAPINRSAADRTGIARWVCGKGRGGHGKNKWRLAPRDEMRWRQHMARHRV